MHPRPPLSTRTGRVGENLTGATERQATFNVIHVVVFFFFFLNPSLYLAHVPIDTEAVT
jgi:hypothetical protein